MFISIDFNRDGRVRVYASNNSGGETVSVVAAADQLPRLLPPDVYTEVRNRIATLTGTFTLIEGSRG